MRLIGANTATPSFTADVTGSYVAQLIVNDGVTNSAPATVTITTNTLALSPNPLTLANGPGVINVTLSSPAGSLGQVVNVAILDTSIATAPASVTVPAGSTTAPITFTPVAVDARLMRDFMVSKSHVIRLSVTGYNLTNHFNALAVHDNVADPQYGTFFGNYHRHYRFDFEIVY